MDGSAIQVQPGDETGLEQNAATQYPELHRDRLHPLSSEGVVSPRLQSFFRICTRLTDQLPGPGLSLFKTAGAPVRSGYPPRADSRAFGSLQTGEWLPSRRLGTIF